MTGIKKWLKLKLSNMQKPAVCHYCHGKLKYMKYTAKINIDKRKSPPAGAVDLDIIITESIMFAKWYAECQKCNASYIFIPGSSSYYYYDGFELRRKNLSKLLPVTNISDDFYAKVSNMRGKHSNSNILNISAETSKIDEE